MCARGGLIQTDHIHKNRWSTQVYSSAKSILFLWFCLEAWGLQSKWERLKKTEGHTHRCTACIHTGLHISVGEVWPLAMYQLHNRCLQWRFDSMDLICALPMLGGFQDWINDHLPARSSTIFTRFTWLSHSDLVYIHFSLWTPYLSLNVCPFCWTIKSASLFSSVYWESVFARRCCSLSDQWFLASRTSSWDQTRTTTGSSDFTALIKDKWTGFNFVLNLTFRAEWIIIYETDRNQKRPTRMTQCYLDGYLGLHVP